MNSDILEGNWKQIRGRVKEWWGRVTDDELDQIEGRKDRLAGILQEKYGYTREQAENSIREFLDSVEQKWEEKTPTPR